jgi:hypothetical protein
MKYKMCLYCKMPWCLNVLSQDIQDSYSVSWCLNVLSQDIQDSYSVSNQFHSTHCYQPSIYVLKIFLPVGLQVFDSPKLSVFPRNEQSLLEEMLKGHYLFPCPESQYIQLSNQNDC